MKSDPFKHEKYNYTIKPRKKKRSFKTDIYEQGAIFTSLKKEKFLHKLKDSIMLFKGRKLLKEKSIYVDKPYRKKRPPWLVPGIFIISITIIVFWIGPFIFNTLSSAIKKHQKNEPKFNLIYNTPDYAIINVPVTDVFEKPDLKSNRKTQGLYNQLVKVIDRKTYGYINVQFDDDVKGYIRSEDLTTKTTSVESSLYKFKLVILTKSKRVMTHSSNGSTVTEVYMGTVLYSNYQGDGIYRVALPGREDGWISSNGVLKLNVDDDIQKSNAKSFYTTVLSFNNSVYINQGLTQNGASSEGIAYISSKVNGVKIPREKQSQINSGTNVPVIYDKETGKLDYENFKEGDLVFFKNPYDSSKVGEMGLFVGYGQVLMSRSSKSSVKILLLDENVTLMQSIMAVRRIF